MEGQKNDKGVFVDSNYFIALFNPVDTFHERARLIGEGISTQDISLVISNFIFLEILTVVSQKVGKYAAVEAGNKIKKNPLIESIHIDEFLQEKSWEIFQEIKRKDVSFVDCSILAVMKIEGIKELLTFDISDFEPLQKQYKFHFYEHEPKRSKAEY